MVKIVQNGDPVLRATAPEVALSDIKSVKVKKVIRDMKKSLATQRDGVAIAAPQIGVSLRIFVVSGKIFDESWKKGDALPDSKNPMHEGCLSVRPLWGEVERSTHATVVAYDESGKKFTRGAAGLLAHIFQHETDHLDGILFIDRARNVAPGIIPDDAMKHAAAPTKKKPAKKVSK